MDKAMLKSNLIDALVEKRGISQKQAEQTVEETVENLWRNGHPHVAAVLALRARIYKTAGKETSAFDRLEALPEVPLRALPAPASGGDRDGEGR